VNLLASSVKWVWAASILLQLVLFVLLFFTHNFRKVRFLTVYVALNLCQAAYIVFLYSGAGASLEGVKLLAWYSEAVTLLFQALAATEAIHTVLEPYRGIWGLSWRAISIVSAILVGYIASHTARSYSWALLEAERGYHLIFATAVVACFVLIRYYSITVPVPFKVLLGGFCFYSCTIIFVSTLFQSIWWGSAADYQFIWQFTSVFAFAVVQALWVVALRKPLPADNRAGALSSSDLYRQLSPEFDERLRLMNEKLIRIWKLEVRS
jgi:hypothetical protein